MITFFQDIPDFVDLISHDIEDIPSPLAFGHKYMTGTFIHRSQFSFLGISQEL